jgi:hypothetical protein
MERFFVAEHGEYSNMHPIQRLYYGQISRAILGELIFSAGPKTGNEYLLKNNLNFKKLNIFF